MTSRQVQAIEVLSQLKLLADERRLKILRLLMGRPATLSQLGDALGLHPARVRHHLKRLEAVGLVALTSTRQVRGFVEKYYQATAAAYRVDLLILPEGGKAGTLLAPGSHDLALDWLASALNADEETPDLLTIPLGSLDGLIALRGGLGQLAGCHLYDPPSGEYNLPYLPHLFPDISLRVMTLTRRQQGLIVAAGNPRGIRALEDLAREDLRFINRNRGSGTRLWLDRALQDAGIPTERIRGYSREASTHLGVARAVAEGEGDLGLGLLAAARKHELDFIPLFEERFDLVILEEHYGSALLAPALERIHTAEFRRAVEALGGYNTAEAGRELPVQ